MFPFTFLLSRPKWIAAIVVVIAMVGGVLYYGHTQYMEGVRDTTSRFVKADREGARNVENTARETLRNIGDNPDVDRLLRDTGGLRNDP